MIAIICGIAALSPIGSRLAVAEDCPVRFAIISDRTGGHTPGVYGDIIDEINRLRPDFVMTVGDLIEGYVDDSARIQAEWDEYDSLVAALSKPIYFCSGNHDIWSEMSADWFRRRKAEPYYSFDRQGLHMVVLENGRWNSSEQLPQEYIDWLRQDLQQASDVAYTMVFYHKPFWYESVFKGEPDILHDIFVQNGVDAVFCGHYHEWFSAEIDGIAYTCVGSSGGGIHPAASGLEYQYAWVTVDADGIHAVPIKKGSVMPWDQASAGDKLAFDRLKHFGLSTEEPLLVEPGVAVENAAVTMVVDNSLTSEALDDTLHWQVPDGWHVSPEAQPVNVAAGDSKAYSFTVSSEGNHFPQPSASVTFKFREGIGAPATSQVEVCRQAHCYQATSPPIIDGQLQEGCWQGAETRLLLGEGSEQIAEPTQFYFAFDDKNLYLAVRCEDRAIDSITARASERDGAIYSDDCIGYFLSPAGRRGPAYQIYFNPHGVAFDQKLVLGHDGWMDYDVSWNGEYDVETQVNADHWILEARIPLATLDASAQRGDTWRVNFRRKQPRVGNADWQTPIEYYPTSFGMLVFE
jgi:predicted phosphodiesterase